MPSGVHTSDRSNKRTKTQKKLHQIEMLRMISRGATMGDVGAALGLHKSQISYDLKKVMAQMKFDRDIDAESIRNQHLARYSEVEKQAWEAWDEARGKFLQEVIYQVLEQVEAAAESGLLDRLDTFQIKVKSNPSGEYLDRVLKAIDRSAELQGVKEPAGKGGIVNVNVSQQINWNLLWQPVDVQQLPDEIENAIAAVEQADTQPLPVSNEAERDKSLHLS